MANEVNQVFVDRNGDMVGPGEYEIVDTTVKVISTSATHLTTDRQVVTLVHLVQIPGIDDV